MEEEKIVKILIADGEYRETYAPLPENPKEAEDKIKRGMLEKRGMSKEEIDSIIDQLDLEFDEGADGRFDDGPYTPVKLVRNVYRRIKEPIVEEVVELEEKELQEPKRPRQVMLQQYYGDREAESKRKKVFDRFKSHIVKKPIKVYDEDGKSRTIEVYTVEDYDTKAKDSDDLLLDGYQMRLERLSRAHQGDFTPYEREYRRLLTNGIKEIMQKYEEMHQVNPQKAEEFKSSVMSEITELKKEESKRRAIQALIDRDTEFIETNNYGYNTRQNTQENLKTLGKYGEKSVRAQISDEQSKLQKMGLHAMNALIELRNHTTAPVNRAVGTYVAAPIYRTLARAIKPKYREPVSVNGYLITPMEDMIATSQKHSSGMFKNKPSHRYHARKDYFLQEESMKIQEKLNDQKDEENKGDDSKPVKKVSLGSLLKLAIIPRVKAIVQYKEGNVAILNAGLHDIEEATQARRTQMKQRKLQIDNANRRIEQAEKEIDELIRLQKVIKDPTKKEQISKAIEVKQATKLIMEGRLAEAIRTEIDSVQTDAISMSQHDKANKANITSIVKGVKTAGRVAIGVYISKYLYREIAHKGKTPDRTEVIPGETKTITETIEKEVVEPGTETVPGLDKEGVGGLTLDNIYSKASGELYEYVKGGRTIKDNTDFFRGLAFYYKGKRYSGSDGRGFDPTVLTGTKIDQELNGESNVISIMQEILQDKTGKIFEREQLEQMLLDGEITNINIWRSKSMDGIPRGWIDASEVVPKLIQEGTHEIPKDTIKKVQETITKTIKEPDQIKFVPGTEFTYYTREINPAIVAAEAGLGVLEASDWNELLRFTRSQESIERRQPRILEAMKAENDRKRAEAKSKGNNSEKDNSSMPQKPTKVKKLREIKSFQRNNKSKIRYYMHNSERMRIASELEAKKRKNVTVWEEFKGSKREDFKSGYDENLLGVDEKEI